LCVGRIFLRVGWLFECRRQDNFFRLEGVRGRFSSGKSSRPNLQAVLSSRGQVVSGRAGFDLSRPFRSMAPTLKNFNRSLPNTPSLTMLVICMELATSVVLSQVRATERVLDRPGIRVVPDLRLIFRTLLSLSSVLSCSASRQ
jgi:hypothetical protein